jgi:hypothetical protein
VPTQNRLGRDEERRPTISWHESGQCGDDCPVGPREPRSSDLAAEDGELVSEHEDLGILGDVAHPMQPSGLDDATDKAIEEAEGHDSAGSPPRSWLVKPKIRLLDPSGSPARRRIDPPLAG